MKLANSYGALRENILCEEGSGYPGKSLVELELAPGYERAKNRLLKYIRIINEAHLLMLCKKGVISSQDGAVIMRAIQNIDDEIYKKQFYDGRFEDLYFEMEAQLIKNTNGAAGNLHLARSRNDMCVAWSHMAVRDKLLVVMEKVLNLQNAFCLFAQEHKDTLYVIHTHTQHAQPGVLGHYFLAASQVLERDFERLKHAYQVVNVSPMGAAAVTTSGFQIDREIVAKLSGFDGVIENAYDAIGNCDYFTETAMAVSLCALNLGRVVTDLTLWATEEMRMIRVADGYISTSSIMPQKRNPIALEHLRASFSVVKGLCDTIQTGFLKSPYGDISDYEDIEDTMFECLELFCKDLDLFVAVIATLDVNKKLLEQRAYESFSVVTEIADEMYRSYQIPFRCAHSFVSFLVKKAEQCNYDLKKIGKEFFAEAYEEFFHEPFKYDFAPIKESIDPWHFVRVRENRGGTGKKAMEAMNETVTEQIKQNDFWLDEMRKRLEQADEERGEMSLALLQNQ